MKTVLIKGQNGSILIHVMSYERSHAENVSDANWLVAKAEINVGCFSGQISLSLTTQDFVRFNNRLDEVLQTLKGKAVFDTDEARLSFSVEVWPRGAAQIKGVVKDTTTDSELIFDFDTDQSYLINTKQLLVAIINDFPEIKVNKEVNVN